MAIDKETKLSYLNVTLRESMSNLESMRSRAEEIGQNDEVKKGQNKFLSVSLDDFTFNTEEYYFDSVDNAIEINGTLGNDEGWFSATLPLSDELLIDILSHSIKRMNKLKVVLENLK